MMKSKIIAILGLSMIMVSSCDLLNCTQADVSHLRIQVCNSIGDQTILSDTLTIMACGTSFVLINRNTNTKEIMLPLSYHAPADTFILQHYGPGYSTTDTLYVNKTNNLFFESPDCPTVMMHTIQTISCTNMFIDSVRIVNNKINFEETTHMKLFIPESKSTQ